MKTFSEFKETITECVYTQYPQPNYASLSDVDANFMEAFKKFMAEAQEIITSYMLKNFPDFRGNDAYLTFENGKRYIRIVRKDCNRLLQGGSAHCFIDKTNGDILKSASWKAPAKGARGNIFNGAKGMTSYGAEYRR